MKWRLINWAGSEPVVVIVIKKHFKIPGFLCPG